MVPRAVEAAGQNAEGYVPLAGGAIFNTAISLGRLEVPVALVSGVSNDLFGAQLVDELAASRVRTDLLIRSNQPTTLAFVKLTDGAAQYTFYDENSAGRMIAPDQFPQTDAGFDVVYFGGISLCAEPAASAYESFALAASRNALMMIDPNIRESFIEDETLYRARLDRMMGAADVVKISDEDLHWIVPGDADLPAKVAQIQSLGVRVVILTKGSDGAQAFVGGTCVAQVKPPVVEVVDTVGAGDTFNAGFLARLHQLGVLSKDCLDDWSDAELTQALDYAARVAAITVQRAGANPPHLGEL